MGPITEFVTEPPYGAFNVLYRILKGEMVGKRTFALAASNIILFAEGALLPPDLDPLIGWGWANSDESSPSRQELIGIMEPFALADGWRSDDEPQPLPLDRENLLRVARTLTSIIPTLL